LDRYKCLLDNCWPGPLFTAAVMALRAFTFMKEKINYLAHNFYVLFGN